jgi:tripartite-type tricarboxylate transporter receptor subunit TctC
MLFARALAAVLLAASIFVGGSAAAQNYPVRPITLICPFPPGGATDAISRIIQDALARSLGQPIVVENVGGAGGSIAATRAARADKDGYTILIHQVALAASITMYPNLTYSEKDFAPIGLINTAASVFAGRPTLPPNNLRELVGWMKEQGHAVKMGHAGVGSYGHLADADTLSRRRPRDGRPAGRAGRPGIARRRRVRPDDQGRQAQGLRGDRPQAVRRPARPADHGRARLQETGS